MNVLAVIMAHHGTEEICRRHLPYWKKDASDLVFFSPANSVVDLPDQEIWAWGRASHHDTEANRRFIHVLEMAARTNFEYISVHEYDSLSLGAIPLRYGRLCGNVFKIGEVDPRFKGKFFIHPPLTMDRSTLIRVVDALHEVGAEAECGFWDRLLGYACERHGIEPFSFRAHGLGYAQNTIEPCHFAEAKAAVANGAVMVHGIKTREAFNAVTHP